MKNSISDNKSHNSKRKQSDRLRDMDTPTVMGYELDRETLTPIRRPLPPMNGRDIGSDPIGNGTFKMFPSGDIVDFAERNRRLN